ncbi:MAG: hypothetical protein IT427_03660 [Pirellulales bacterium]|nr:hypothetical protein [Pirellulales bacterium]
MAHEFQTKTDILRAIGRLHRTGKKLNYSAIRTANGRLLAHAKKHFGTWKQAVTAAGLDYDKISRIHRWSNQEILSQLRDLHRRRQFPDIRSLAKKFTKLYDACLRHYGSGLAALEAAGIDYQEMLNEHPYRWTRAHITAEIKRRHAAGKTLRRTEMLRKEPEMHRFCYATLHHFRTWGNALREAGLNPRTVRNRDARWPRQRVLKEIRRRFEQGKFLNTDLMLREALPLHAAGRRYFGTWKAAVEKAGIDYNMIRGGLVGWTKTKAVRALRERVVLGGHSQKHIREHAPSLFRAAIHHFGTWDEAIHRARKGK